MNKIFCQRLKQLRLDETMSQANLAKHLNIAPNTISSWERGNSSPSIDELKILAEIFKCSADYLLGLED